MTKLVAINGMNRAFADALVATGVETTELLAEQGATPAGRAALAERSTLPRPLLLHWIFRIDQERIKGVSWDYANLLVSSGVTTITDLGTRNAAELHAALQATNQRLTIVRRLPTLVQIRDWIDQARSLPSLIDVDADDAAAALAVDTSTTSTTATTTTTVSTSSVSSSSISELRQIEQIDEEIVFRLHAQKTDAAETVEPAETAESADVTLLSDSTLVEPSIERESKAEFEGPTDETGETTSASASLAPVPQESKAEFEGPTDETTEATSVSVSVAPVASIPVERESTSEFEGPTDESAETTSASVSVAPVPQESTAEFEGPTDETAEPAETAEVTSEGAAMSQVVSAIEPETIEATAGATSVELPATPEYPESLAPTSEVATELPAEAAISAEEEATLDAVSSILTAYEPESAEALLPNNSSLPAEDAPPAPAGIPGIDAEALSRLSRLGIATPELLVQRSARWEDRAGLSEASGVSQFQLMQWLYRADLQRVAGIDDATATLLVAAGVTTVPDLAHRTPDELYAVLASLGDQQRRFSYEQLQAWITQARDTPGMLTFPPTEVY